MSTTFKKGDRVLFVAGNGKVYHGTFIRKFSPAANAGPHYRIAIEGGAGAVATIFANGEVGKSVERIV